MISRKMWMAKIFSNFHNVSVYTWNIEICCLYPELSYEGFPKVLMMSYGALIGEKGINQMCYETFRQKLLRKS